MIGGPGGVNVHEAHTVAYHEDDVFHRVALWWGYCVDGIGLGHDVCLDCVGGLCVGCCDKGGGAKQEEEWDCRFAVFHCGSVCQFYRG